MSHCYPTGTEECKGRDAAMHSVLQTVLCDALPPFATALCPMSVQIEFKGERDVGEYATEYWDGEEMLSDAGQCAGGSPLASCRVWPLGEAEKRWLLERKRRETDRRHGDHNRDGSGDGGGGGGSDAPNPVPSAWSQLCGAPTQPLSHAVARDIPFFHVNETDRPPTNPECRTGPVGALGKMVKRDYCPGFADTVNLLLPFQLAGTT